MKLQEIEQKPLGLSENERAELVVSLRRTLVAPGSDVTDDEVVRRDAEMEAGGVEPMLHEQFVRRFGKSAGDEACVSPSRSARRQRDSIMTGFRRV